MNAIRYQVTADGQVVNVKTTDGKEVQRIEVTKSKDMPWGMIRTGSRFEDLKRAVGLQEPGYWYVYDGFKGLDEARHAQSAINRRHKDQILKTYLNGKKVQTTLDLATSRLAVLVTVNEVQP